MAHKYENKTVFSLAEVARSIQKTISLRYHSSYWIRAEMNRLNYYAHSGHCYPELVEKQHGKVIAEMRSILWKADFDKINQRLVALTGEPLKNGISILFQANISYDPLYGLSLRILDIDPSFSLGEIEREKQETIFRLKKEQIFNANKTLVFPLLPKQIAVISVETSKGYADFLKVLTENPWGYRFDLQLFPALLQGDKSIPSIIEQLSIIASRSSQYDAVAIIRGGGGDIGLSSYNNYQLAATIAQFPLPVLTGIGHSTNETVSEMVSYHNAITPTELADYLVQHFHNFAVPLANAEQTIIKFSTLLLRNAETQLNDTIRYFQLNSIIKLDQQRQSLDTAGLQLNMHTMTRVRHALHLIEKLINDLNHQMVYGIKQHTSDIDKIQLAIRLLDPQHVLNRGYSITKINGKAVTTSKDIAANTLIETTLANGTLISKTV